MSWLFRCVMWDDWCCTAHVAVRAQALFVTVPSKRVLGGHAPSQVSVSVPGSVSAQRHHTTNSSIQAARDPSHARDFADGARLSQSCTRLPRTRFNGRISEWHRKRSLIGASAQQVFSALFVDERTSVSSTVHDMRCDQTHERLTACF